MPVVRLDEYIYNVLVPTSVHIPKPLLSAVDRKARLLGISRNRLIVRALEREMAEPSWSPGFFDRLLAVDDRTVREVDVMEAAIHAGRRSKPALKL